MSQEVTAMRSELLPFVGKRVSVTGVLIRFDWFPTKWGLRKKVLLKYVRENKGRFMTHHTSLSDPVDVRTFEGFESGDVLHFSAIVFSYPKGYIGENAELRFTHPLSVDYGFRHVQALTCISKTPQSKPKEYPFPIEELKSRRKVCLGVC